MNTKEITILTTWKWEVFEIEMKYEDYLVLEKNCKAKREDWFNSSKYRQFIKFSSIESIKWKTLYLALPEPKKPKLTKKDMQVIQAEIKRWLEITFEGRKKRFLDRREETLKQLEKEEKYFDLETTIFKLNDYNKVKNELLLLNNK